MVAKGIKAALCCAGASLLALAMPCVAQQTPPPATATPAPTATPPLTIDPNAALAPLPGLGVDWPDLSHLPPEPADADAATLAGDVRYDYRIDGIDDLKLPLLRQRFSDLSVLKAHDNATANAAQLTRRGREDSTLLVTLLKAEGYYDARVTSRIEPRQGRPLVVLEAVPGQLYKLDRVTIAGVDAAGVKAPALTNAFGVKPGDVLNADKVAAGQDQLKVTVGEEGFPFAKVGDSAIVVDHATKSATLDLSVDPNGVRRYGTITTNPNNRVFGAKHVQEMARFRPGDVYNAAQIDDLRRAIVQTSLVSTVAITPVDAAPGVVDLDVKLERAPPRTIAGELGYGTGEGARAEVDWTHRNLFPPEGALTLRGVLGTQEQLAGVQFQRSNFHGRDRVLNAQLTVSNLQRAAYRAKSVSLTGGIERQSNIFFQKKWTWSLGGELTASDERDTIVATGMARRQTYFIGAIPASLTYDGSDDLLDPHRGFRLGGRVSPEVSLEGKVFGYARVQFDASAYQPLSERVVLAERARFGTILGAPRDAVAPSRRFYAGGGGSVRGYSYQAIGPRDVDNNPIGGRSLTELSVEARVRFGNFGVVPFLDAGNISTAPVPPTSLRYGAGIGLRYYSNFGPIRIDVGTPLNRQPGDSRIGVYVSLGQAF